MNKLSDKVAKRRPQGVMNPDRVESLMSAKLTHSFTHMAVCEHMRVPSHVCVCVCVCAQMLFKKYESMSSKRVLKAKPKLYIHQP